MDNLSENETFIRLIQAAMEDVQFRSQLMPILKADQFNRDSIINSFASDLRFRGKGNGQLLEAILSLRDQEIVDRVLAIINQKEEPQKSYKWFFILGATTLFLVCGYLLMNSRRDTVIAEINDHPIKKTDPYFGNTFDHADNLSASRFMELIMNEKQKEMNFTVSKDEVNQYFRAIRRTLDEDKSLKAKQIESIKERMSKTDSPGGKKSNLARYYEIVFQRDPINFEGADDKWMVDAFSDSIRFEKLELWLYKKYGGGVKKDGKDFYPVEAKLRLAKDFEQNGKLKFRDKEFENKFWRYMNGLVKNSETDKNLDLRPSWEKGSRVIFNVQ